MTAPFALGVASRREAQAGASVLSFALWLVLASLAMTAAMRYAGDAMDQANARSFAMDLSAFKSGVQSRFQDGSSSYAGISVQSLAQARLVPKGLLNPDGRSLVALGGRAITLSTVGRAVDHDTLVLSFPVRRRDCAGVLTAISRDFEHISVGGLVVKDVIAGDATISPADMARCPARTATGADVAIALRVY